MSHLIYEAKFSRKSYHCALKIVFATGTDFDTISVSVQDQPLKASRLMRRRIPGPFPASIQTLLKNKVNKTAAHGRNPRDGSS